jgi:hypothetical protein
VRGPNDTERSLRPSASAFLASGRRPANPLSQEETLTEVYWVIESMSFTSPHLLQRLCAIQPRYRRRRRASRLIKGIHLTTWQANQSESLRYKCEHSICSKAIADSFS